MIRNLYFVRHGHYRLPPKNIGGILTIMGVEAIVEVAHKLAKLERQYATIYASPLQRTQETAKLLARILKIPVETREGLHEAFTAENTVEHFHNIYANFEEVINEALENTEGINIIVSHQLPISLFLSVKAGIKLDELTKNYSYLDLLKMGECLHAVFNEKELVHYEKI